MKIQDDLYLLDAMMADAKDADPPYQPLDNDDRILFERKSDGVGVGVPVRSE